MDSWEVDLGNVGKKLKKDRKNGKITSYQFKIIKEWVSQVEEFGPNSLKKLGFWRDHALKGIWQGYRSSSFGPAGRIIYQVKRNKLIVKVLKITDDHNYNR